MEVTKVKQQLVALQLGKDYSCPSRAYLAVSVYKKCFSISFLTMGHYAFVWLHHCVTALITTWYVPLIIAFSFSRKHQKFLAESSTSICNQWFASQLHQLPGLQSPAAQDTNVSLTSYTEVTYVPQINKHKDELLEDCNLRNWSSQVFVYKISDELSCGYSSSNNQPFLATMATLYNYKSA